eukprot:3810250-Amphidinium_carterae.2
MSLLSGSLRERKTNYHMVWPIKLGLLNPPTKLVFVKGEVQKTTEELGYFCHVGSLQKRGWWLVPESR